MPLDREDFAARMRFDSEVDQAKQAMLDFISDAPALEIFDDQVVRPWIRKMEQAIDADPDNGQAYILYHVLWLGRASVFEALLNRANLTEDHPDVF